MDHVSTLCNSYKYRWRGVLPMKQRMSRRQALKGGSAAAVAVGAGILSQTLVRKAQAAGSGDPRILLGDAGVSPDEAGEITHKNGDIEVFSGSAVRNLTNPVFPSIDVKEIQMGGSRLYSKADSDFIEILNGQPIETPRNTTSTVNTGVANCSGSFPLSQTPPTATLYGNFIARFHNTSTGDTAYVFPKVVDGGGNAVDVTELELSVTGTTLETKSSGWVELTSLNTNSNYQYINVRGYVDSGELEFSGVYCGLAIGWRL